MFCGGHSPLLLPCSGFLSLEEQTPKGQCLGLSPETGNSGSATNRPDSTLVFLEISCALFTKAH